MTRVGRVFFGAGKVLLMVVALILTGVFVALFVMVSAEYSRTHWVPSRNWILMGLFTTITFSALVFGFTPSWHRTRFWLTISVLLALHIGAFTLILSWEHQSWPAIVFFLVSIGEAYVLDSALLRLGFHERGGVFPIKRS